MFTPLIPGAVIHADRDSPPTTAPFAPLLGNLLFVANGSRPDITQSVSFLARFSTHPTDMHWKALINIVRYLKSTINFKIFFPKQHSHEMKVVGYCDADFAGDLDDRKSTTGFIFFCNGTPITWKSKKQTIMAGSSAEAEYIALNNAANEAMYFKNLLGDLHLAQEPITIFEDNQSALAMASTNDLTRTRHIGVKFHSVRFLVAANQLHLQYIPTAMQRADILTKQLPKPTYSSLVSRIGLHNTFQSPEFDEVK